MRGVGKKNENKLKEYLRKKHDFKQSDSEIKNDSTKPSDVTNIRRGRYLRLR